MVNRSIAQASFGLLAGLIAGLATTVALADERAPSIEGTWAGRYAVAFPKSHPTYGDRSVETSMELEVYRQEEHLIWVINRWRRNDSDPWVVEYGTGAFDLEDHSKLVIAEQGPAPEPNANTGFFVGEYDDGKIYLTYGGVGGGISFSVELSRKH